MVRWSRSNDPILTRYGVGSLARIAAAGQDGALTVAKCGGLQALVEALGGTDGQTQCYAAKAVGALRLGPACLTVGRPLEAGC